MSSQPATGTVVDCTILASTFPTPVTREIPRDAILNLIDDFFSAGVQLVALEGKPEMGKTRLLAQFAMRRPYQTISIFLKPSSWFGKDPSLLYADVATQMHCALHKSELANPHSADEAFVRRLSFDLQRSAKRTGLYYYFLVDGIEDLPDNAGQLSNTLLAILPFEFSSFRFLFSGETKWLPTSVLSNMVRKTYPVPGLSLEETITYFDCCGASRAEVEELYRSCSRGTPGYLASARRLLEGGMSVRTLIEQLPKQLPNPFQIEWQAVREADEQLLDALTILSYDSIPHSVSDLAALLAVGRDDLGTRLARCRFLELPQDHHSPVTYLSNSFRRFASEQLANRREAVWDKLIAHLIDKNDNENALDLLPSYLEEAGRSDELLDVLDPGTFLRLAERADSLLPLQGRSKLGLSTAVKLKKAGEAIRFGVQAGAVTEFNPAAWGRAEVIARLAIGDYDTALSLAQSARLKHQRLQLLAAIARYQHEQGLTAEPALLDSIEKLLKQIEVRELGEDVIELASDLMYSRSDLALQLISGLAPDTSDDRGMDWALVKLSALAAQNRPSHASELSDMAADLRARIKDPAARRFSRAISLVVGRYTVADVLRHVESLDSAGERIYLLRQWCLRTMHPENATRIIDYAVHLTIRTTEYTPTATDFKDLATPLPNVSNVQEIRSLITAFDIQKEAIRKTGPTQDYVHLQLLLAHAETRLTPEQGGQRLVETYYEVQAIKNLAVRAVCLGLIAAASADVDPHGAFEDTPDVKKLVESEFLETVQLLLEATAEHYKITRSVIEAVSKKVPELALKVAKLLNTEVRRDSALEDLIQHILEQPSKAINIEFVERAIGQFADPDMEDKAVEAILTRFAKIDPPSLTPLVIAVLKKCIERARSIINPVIGCRALSAALVIMHKGGVNGAMGTAVQKALKDIWQSIDDPRTKLEAGYDIVTSLANHGREAALWYLAATDEVKLGHADLTGTTVINCLGLAIRAFSGLLPKQVETGTDIERLTTQIERIPSRMFKVWLWSDLALRCFANKRGDEGRRIVNQHIRPLLESLKVDSRYEWTVSTITAAPALYEANSATTIDLLLTLPPYSRDNAFDHVLSFKTTKTPSWEPFKAGKDQAHHLDFDECHEILKLAERLDTDYLAYRYIIVVAASAIWRHNKHALAEEQRNQLAHMIRELAKKFPNPRHIKHEGFKVLAEAQALRLVREKRAEWAPIIEKARRLPNNSDRVLVLALIAEYLHSGLATQKTELLREAVSLAANIPSTHDKVGRLRSIATVAQDIDRPLARAIISDAMQLVKNDTTGTGRESRRDLVDLAHQIDPDFASSLASSLDDDNARRAARESLNYQKLKDDLLDQKKPINSEYPRNNHDYARAFWDLLGLLNAGRVEPREVPDTLRSVALAGDQPLRLSFPILSWAIQNAIVRRAHADEAKRLVREMFEATMNSAELAAAFVGRGTNQSVRTISGEKREPSKIIRADERETALEYLREWLRRSASGYLKICDPYFGPKDLEILQLVLSVGPSLHVTIITSRKQQEQERVESPADEYYARYWQKNFSDQTPPRTEIVVVGGRSGELPIHDRWWLTRGSGLRLGTSFSGLGKIRDSEISELSQSEIEERLALTDMYITREKREHLGEKLSYQFFEL